MPKIIIYVPFLRVAGMAIFPFILVGKKHYRHDQVLINHEQIHLVQQLEMLILPFYFFYLLNYFVNLIRYREHHSAYINIFFEREAYTHERDLNYLKSRKFWSFSRYIDLDSW